MPVDMTKRQWNPDDPELSSDMCAHEVSAFRRLRWLKWPDEAIRRRRPLHTRGVTIKG